MKKWWAPAFTIVELIIVVAVIGILAAISIVAYGGIQRTAADKAMKSDLEHVTGEMQRVQLQNNGLYPTTLPVAVKSSPNITLNLKYSGTFNFYAAAGPLTPVQNGVLMSQICQDLIDEGIGKGKNQNGVTQDYITGCGNWNHDSMQFTGWNTKKFSTPVSDNALLAYADNFTTSDNFNKAHETVVKTFYHALVDRHVRQGGTYPITTFWDFWANSGNGGVMNQPLPTPRQQPWYCVEATHASYPDLRWHVTNELKILPNAC